MLNLDTHVLLHALAGSLTPRERSLVEREPWSISTIVLWEIGKLAELGRIEGDLDSPGLTRPVVRAIPPLDFESDPTEKIIAATSVVHRVPLVTRDRRIGASRVVPLAR